ncbi:MAG: hypothetical protein WDM81_13660 [Rhizomicrobium sp.]
MLPNNQEIPEQATIVYVKGADGSYVPLTLDAAAGTSGITASASFAPTAAAYGAGDIMDVPKEFAFTYANGVAIRPGALIRILSSVTKIAISAVPANQTSYTLRTYSRTPPSALADNALWIPKAVDQTCRRKPIALGTPILEAVGGEFLAADAQYIDADIKLEDTSSSLWANLVTDGAHTAAAVARQVILYGIVL